MTSHVLRLRPPWLLALALALGLAPLASAQEGLSVTRETVEAALDAIEVGSGEVTWTLSPRARASLNAERLRLKVRFQRPRPGAPPVLEQAELEALGGRRLELPGTGRRVRKITLWKED
jgi:hypothetical protein